MSINAARLPIRTTHPVCAGEPLSNIPWESRPNSTSHIIWRSSENPIIPWDVIPSSNSIFNSAVVPFNGQFAGVFRIDDTSRHMDVHAGRSIDGIHWDIDPHPISFVPSDPELARSEYKYDPRVCWLEDRYYITWCNGDHGPTIGIGYTYDFQTFHHLCNAFLPFNRNGVLFPRKINERYAMLNRPSDNGHTPFGDIYYSESPDMIFWGRHRHMMSAGGGWESTKIGAGPIPIETSEGWLLIYHGVLTSCNGFVYSFGAALLDLDQPWKVIHRARPYLMAPKMPYEISGDVPNVVFPCAALVDAPTNRIAVYYGGADTVVCLAYTYMDELLDWIKTNSA